jgi:hypothetical protein
MANLWRYRALAGGYYIFKHEYVIILQKPEAPIDVREELLKVKRMPPWQRAQDDAWDRVSRYIYATDTLYHLRRKTRRVAKERGLPLHDFGSYVLHRWYNYHTHQVALGIVLDHSRTRPEKDPFHHTVDFYLDGVGFDLKLTRFPNSYPHDLAHACAHPEQLARWLYAQQSGEGRYHAANRLFVVLYDAVDPSRTWALRRDFARLSRAIGAFLDTPRPLRVAVEDPSGKIHRPLAGVIFCVNED